MIGVVRQLVSLLVLLIPLSTIAAPKAELWDEWLPHAETASVSIDHSPWQGFLDGYLVRQGEHALVRYGKVSSQDKQTLDDYIQSLAKLDPHTLTRDQQYAYWVNLYNALTVQLIIDNYPLKSITKLGGFFAFGPWDLELVTINGKALSLNDIEHRILRPIWDDPRTHYAVNCASLGCPNLQDKAYTEGNIEALLTKAERQFIQSDKGVKNTGNGYRLSSIYEWFVVDFGGEQAMLDYLSTKTDKLNDTNLDVTYDYDWSLNDAK